MNKDRFAGKWQELKGKIKEKWGKLTDDDITQIHGKWDQLAGKLQHKYGWAKEEADREIDSWCSSCCDDKGCSSEHEIKKDRHNHKENGRNNPHGNDHKHHEGKNCSEPHPHHDGKHKSRDDDHKKRKAG